MLNNKNVKLEINLLSGRTYKLTLSRNYAEKLMEAYYNKIFKRGIMKIGHLNCNEKIQMINIKYITSMIIYEKG